MTGHASPSLTNKETGHFCGVGKPLRTLVSPVHAARDGKIAKRRHSFPEMPMLPVRRFSFAAVALTHREREGGG